MRLIDADALKRIYNGNGTFTEAHFRTAIDEQPTVDALPVYMVKQMRDAQKRYFRTRDADALQESKQLERDIDKLISNDGTVQGRLF